MAQGLIDNRFLNVARFKRIIETVSSQFARTRPLLYIDQLPSVNAADEDLVGRFTMRPIAADIIAEDQAARVVDAGKVEMVVNELAKIKIGRMLPERMINLLARLTQGTARADEEDAFMDYTLRIAEECVLGVRDRMNWMACRMMIDDLSYDAFGIKFDASWAMPSNLKVTPTELWSEDSGTTVNQDADPINDILSLDIVDTQNYYLGPFDRITMGSSAFKILANNNNFLSKFWIGFESPIAFAPTAAQIAANDWGRMMQVMGRVLNKEIRIDDRRIQTQLADGTFSGDWVLPRNKILLDRKSNGPQEMDWGNGMVTESIVADIVGSAVTGDTPGNVDLNGAYGPLGYYTAGAELNPPTIKAWGVARGFPRKHVPESTAVLTIW